VDVTDLISQTRVEPRPYQQRIVQTTAAMFNGEHRNGAGQLEPAARSVMVESPTGSGKTVMGLLAAKLMQKQHGVKVGWVAMRRNLLAQTAEENRRMGIDVEPIQFLSMFEKNPPTDLDLLVVDEAQHDAASSMAHLHNTIRPRWILGLTATPFRTDRIKLCFDKVIKDAGIHQLIQDGYLSEYHHYTIPCWNVPTVAEFYLREPERWGKSIFFFRTTEECFELRDLLQAQGVVCDVVTGSSRREEQIARFLSGEVPVLINCMVLTEGFDCPDLQTVFCRDSAKVRAGLPQASRGPGEKHRAKQNDRVAFYQGRYGPAAISLAGGRMAFARGQPDDQHRQFPGPHGDRQHFRRTAEIREEQSRPAEFPLVPLRTGIVESLQGNRERNRDNLCPTFPNHP